MAGEETFLTKEGYNKLVKELEHLKKSVRPELLERVQETRESGELEENYEYLDAKDELIKIEERIVQIEGKLKRVRIIENERLPKDTICIGSNVKLRNIRTGKIEEYIISSPEEVDPGTIRISVNSPVAKSLIGKKKGQKVEIKVPAGLLKYQVVTLNNGPEEKPATQPKPPVKKASAKIASAKKETPKKAKPPVKKTAALKKSQKPKTKPKVSARVPAKKAKKSGR